VDTASPKKIVVFTVEPFPFVATRNGPLIVTMPG
jgi:hypothetical protein